MVLNLRFTNITPQLSSNGNSLYSIWIPSPKEALREILRNFRKHPYLESKSQNYNQNRCLETRREATEASTWGAETQPNQLPPLGTLSSCGIPTLWKAAKSHSGSRSLTSDPGQDLARLTVRSGPATLTHLPATGHRSPATGHRPPVRKDATLGVMTAPLARLECYVRARAPPRGLKVRFVRPLAGVSQFSPGLFRRPHFRLFWRLGIQDQGQFGFWQCYIVQLEMTPTVKRRNTWLTKDN
ncbi:uncharacterized protein LOC116574093 [Mustela erminea]|uniref:uncharacterized protein LOC116574093 n=1 Tax=Mustela erminea TaxID=36723 RepID=UPI0013874400|nr:uncharacterized protein LOC116574093 [Mustela erminea]